jgi:DNA-binding response OmpR family regulator
MAPCAAPEASVNNLVHEIRNHLAVAIANIEGLRDGVLAATPQRLSAIVQALEEAGVLLGELPATTNVCVLVATDGRTAVEFALREAPDLVLLDLNVPKRPELDAFREIRAQAAVAAPARVPHDVARIGDLAIDRTAHEVTRAGAVVKLTPTEFRLLGIFVDHPGQVFARDHLIELLSNDGGDVFDRTLDRHVANLRAKIERDVAHPAYVLTVYGVGYKMADVS